MIEFDGVSKTFGAGHVAVDALSNITLTVSSGELVAVMGPSGSGKTTLLSIAGGLETCSAGTVRVDGVDLTTMTWDERAHLRLRSVGYVFQELNLLPGLTAGENVAFPLELAGARAAASQGAAQEQMAELGVGDLSDRFPDDLSGGERQRIAIARALIGDRCVVLADEPTGALDSVNGEQVMRILRRACEGGVAGMVVTHDAQLAAWAHKVVFLRDGRIVDETAPAALDRVDPVA
ncbi:macrolide export ATP-binding/permease protein MacB [bacterium BMS3Bbin02]|nr:macrolide export ATP-binding/permease protein MacB [bacterium BMS3Bbin02]